MSCATSFHHQIAKYNPLETPTKQLEQYFKKHPEQYKGVLIANHLFRAISMWAFLKYNRNPMQTKLFVCFAGSLMYRMTVEVNCAYKFALPALGGAAAFMMGSRSLTKVVNGAAFYSLKAFSNAFASLIPMEGYFVYITLTTSYDVDHPRRHCG